MIFGPIARPSLQFGLVQGDIRTMATSAAHALPLATTITDVVPGHDLHAGLPDEASAADVTELIGALRSAGASVHTSAAALNRSRADASPGVRWTVK